MHFLIFCHINNVTVVDAHNKGLKNGLKLKSECARIIFVKQNLSLQTT